MSRMAVLVGRTAAGKLVVAGVAEGAELQTLKALRETIRDNGGIMKQGKLETKLTEMRMLSNHTSGGELYGALRWGE